MNNEVENEYQPSNVNLEQKVANLSHELRTPLVVITGYTELLIMSESNNAIGDGLNLRETLEVIRRNVNVVVRLINDLVEILGEGLNSSLVFDLRVTLTSITGWMEMLLIFERDNTVDSQLNLREILEIVQGKGTTLELQAEQLLTTLKLEIDKKSSLSSE